MTLFSTPEFKVGVLVVTVSTLIGVMSMKVAEGPGMFLGKKKFDVIVDDAGGLVKNSAVKMAGIKVGLIDDIVLEDGRARLKLVLEKDAPITVSSRALLKADGILGDRHVELVPGLEGESRLESGQLIPLKDGGANGFNSLMTDVSKVSKSLDRLLGTLNKAIGEGAEDTKIGRIVDNLEKLTQDLSQITSQNKDKIASIVDRIDSLAHNLNRFAGEDNLDRLSQSLRNIEEITDKINRGEGTIGKLINDDKTVDELNSAITNVNRFLGGADVMETSIDFHSEYLASSAQAKSYLGVKIQPGLDRYYLVQVVDDPLGYKESTYTQMTNGSGVTSSEQKTVTFQNKVKLTALFAKNFYDFTIRGGIIESSGGVGLDYHLFDRQFTLSTEFFKFSDLYARAYLRYQVMKGIYVTGGGDNLFKSEHNPANAFFGAGIFLTNDDLKTLASKISF